MESNQTELKYIELIRQEYGGNHCVFSAGFVDGENKPIEDTVYLKLEKIGVEPTILHLRPDELQALAWCAVGVNWSVLLQEKRKQLGI